MFRSCGLYFHSIKGLSVLEVVYLKQLVSSQYSLRCVNINVKQVLLHKCTYFILIGANVSLKHTSDFFDATGLIP